MQAKKTTGTAAKPAAAAAAQSFHYFGSTAFNWAVGDTRAEVLAALASMAGRDIIATNKKNNGGLYAWTCRVDLPRTAHYDIQNYAPAGVPTRYAREDRIVDRRGYVVPLEPAKGGAND